MQLGLGPARPLHTAARGLSTDPGLAAPGLQAGPAAALSSERLASSLPPAPPEPPSLITRSRALSAPVHPLPSLSLEAGAPGSPSGSRSPRLQPAVHAGRPHPGPPRAHSELNLEAEVGLGTTVPRGAASSYKQRQVNSRFSLGSCLEREETGL